MRLRRELLSSAGSRPALETSRASSSPSRSPSSFSPRTRTGISAGSSGGSPRAATRSSSRRMLPGLLSLAALGEVNLVGRDELGVTAVERLRPIRVDDAFRVMCEFDAERSELFLSRATILVEGMTEKISPAVRVPSARPSTPTVSRSRSSSAAARPTCRSSSRSADEPGFRSSSSMTATFGRSCEPLEDDLRLNALIRKLAGARRTVVLDPDFEARSRVSRERAQAGTRLVPAGARAARRAAGAARARRTARAQVRGTRVSRRTADPTRGTSGRSRRSRHRLLRRAGDRHPRRARPSPPRTRDGLPG